MDLFELKPKQKAAFVALEKAIKECNKSGLLMYNNYGTIGVCDKSKVKAYNDHESMYKHGDFNNPNEVKLPCNEWADDTHYFHPA